MTGIIDTLKADGSAIETFLVAEGDKIVAWAKTAEAPVVSAFEQMIGQAKADVAPLAQAAETAVATELSNLEADFETAIANALSKLTNGQASTAGASPEVLLTTLGAAGVQQLATQASALIGPLFVKVISAAIKAVA